MSEPARLELEGVAKRFGTRTLFSGVSLRLHASEYVAVLGESGVGKSTLLHAIAGLEPVQAGAIRHDGADITRLDDDAATRLRRERIGFVFQAFHLLPHLTAVQNVALPLLLRRWPAPEVFRRSRELLAAVGLAERAESFPRELSGGEMQRVAIARALAGAPRLVLADEPTGNLDADNAREVLALLRAQVKTHGAAAILVTHSAQAAAGCDRRYRLTASGLQPEP